MYFDQVSFLSGFLFGFLIAGIIGAMWNRIQLARNAMRSPDRPMNVPTQNTPRTVMANAARASQTCMVWSLGLFFFVIFVLILLFYVLTS